MYAVLRSKYPDRRSVSTEELYQWIGHPEHIGIPAWENTCAVRMSLALIRAGVPVQGERLLVQAGECQGKLLQPSQTKLARFLARGWGAPERYAGGPAAQKGIGNRHGVISFYHLWGPTDRQGHIDLVAPYSLNDLACEEDCYWSSTEVWFWSLK
ncbi:type VI secretion system amidase effector protein Tae4 [Massilia solisilvae]